MACCWSASWSGWLGLEVCFPGWLRVLVSFVGLTCFSLSGVEQDLVSIGGPPHCGWWSPRIPLSAFELQDDPWAPVDTGTYSMSIQIDWCKVPKLFVFCLSGVFPSWLCTLDGGIHLGPITSAGYVGTSVCGECVLGHHGIYPCSCFSSICRESYGCLANG